MSPGARKRSARKLLQARDCEDLVRWTEVTENPVKILVSLTFDDSALVRWRALEAVGWVMWLEASKGVEGVHRFLRQLLWQMRGEAEGMWPHAPQMIGEVLANVPQLIAEYLPLLPAYLTEKPYEKGAHAGLWRATLVQPDKVSAALPDMTASLSNTDPDIRAFTILIMQALPANQNLAAVEKLKDDAGRFRQYDYVSGTLVETSVGRLAIECLRNGSSKGKGEQEIG